MIEKYSLRETEAGDRFADTRDTLCYATYDNQTAVYGLLNTPADLALVVGGYNSSNTSHLVELCEEALPTYFIDSANKIISETEISHYDFHQKINLLSPGYLPVKNPVKILLTSGASCPDAVVEEVIVRLVSFFKNAVHLSEVQKQFE